LKEEGEKKGSLLPLIRSHRHCAPQKRKRDALTSGRHIPAEGERRRRQGRDRRSRRGKRKGEEVLLSANTTPLNDPSMSAFSLKAVGHFERERESAGKSILLAIRSRGRKIWGFLLT